MPIDETVHDLVRRGERRSDQVLHLLALTMGCS
jgi:hypothetical protein